MPDYRTMTGGEWVFWAILVLLCLFVAVVLAFRPMVLWRSTQRWRAPQQKPEELGEPTGGFKAFSLVLALVMLACAVYCGVGPFLSLR